MLEQIEAIARLIAVPTDAFNLTIYLQCVMMRGEAADNEVSLDLDTRTTDACRVNTGRRTA